MLRSLGEMKVPRLLYRGAEAEIYLEEWYGKLAVRKSRVPKPYRVVELDTSIRRSRMLHETNLLHQARRIGISVPIVQHLDSDSSSFIMEFVDGPTLKEELFAAPGQTTRQRCTELGMMVASLHEGGLIHGDLTISNVISSTGKLFLIDFGLGDLSTEIEDRGVDLLLLNRALKSTHSKSYEAIFRAFLRGYAKVVGNKQKSAMVAKMHLIEHRGRYSERT